MTDTTTETTMKTAKREPLIIYHANCADGFTAAWVAYLHSNRTAETHAAGYGSPPPDVRGRNVYIVDFSYDRYTLEQMHEAADSLHVYDHHKTAEADLEGLDFCTFDMDRSGAGLVWDCLMDGPRPWLVDYVEDRDLWRWALPDSKAVSEAIAVTPKRFHEWDAMKHRGVNKARREGAAILRKVEVYVSSMQSLVYHLGRTPIVNAPFAMVSELLHEMCEREKIRHESPDWMAIAWHRSADGLYAHSIRGIGGVDVSIIAKHFGGGGHAHAAGFVLTDGPLTEGAFLAAELELIAKDR